MPNALAGQTSPYLRQHRSNPVDWQPWGDVAFEAARASGRPILLSIGYAACHWCHVMARESFEDPVTAALMNERFVNIKVDREERPDVDAVHVRALQAMGRRAGWPLTIFLTPSGKPFWGGTYFPPVARGRQLSFRDVLTHVSDAFQSDPAATEMRAQAIVASMSSGSDMPAADQAASGASGANVLGALDSADASREQADMAARTLLANVDPVHGGLAGTPKFPYPAVFRFLWHTGCRNGDASMQDAVVLTLKHLVDGGVFDHLGGGFARYSTDERWLVPHFEKMLYDNALLVHLLADAWCVHAEPAFAEAVERSIGWLLREMRLPGGAFACSLDADSEHEEGAFYVWQADEVARLLGAGAPLFMRAYDVTAGGNFEGRNILNRLSAQDAFAAQEDADLALARSRLFEARSARVPPPRDDKVLADWNGMTIAALTRAAVVFDRPQWLEAARGAFAFVTTRMVDGDDLCHSWCDDVLNRSSIIDDYAAMAGAALALHEATGEHAFIDFGRRWVDRCTDLFCNAQTGAFYYTPQSEGTLAARFVDGRDTATPSGNGMMAQVLARLYFLTGDDRYRRQAERLVGAFSGQLERESFQLATLLDAGRLLACAVQIVIVGDAGDAQTRSLLRAAHRQGGVDRVVLRVDPGAAFADGHPAQGKTASGGRPTAYVCSGSTCSAPVFEAQGLAETLQGSGVNPPAHLTSG